MEEVHIPPATCTFNLDSIHIIKEQGNSKFGSGDYDGARRLYSEALDNIISIEVEINMDLGAYEYLEPLLKLKTALLGNRGLVHLRMKSYFAAIRDLTNCINLCRKSNAEICMPSYMTFRFACTLGIECKAIYRRSLAFREIGNIPSANRDVLTIFALLQKDQMNDNAIPPDIVAKVKRDVVVLADIKRPVTIADQPEHKNDKRLNYFGAQWKPVWSEKQCCTRGLEGHSAVYWNKGIYVLGGRDIDHTEVQHLKVFNLKARAWKILPWPRAFTELYGHSAVVWRDSMIIYGGDSYACISDVWQFNFKSHQWKTFRTKGKVPYLSEHTACVISEKMYVFGGRGSLDGKYFGHSNDLYSLDLITRKWTKLSGTHDRNPYVDGIDLPEPRYNHAMWPDQWKNRIYILGGSMRRESCSYESTTLDDFWYYDIEKSLWVKEMLFGNAPAPRCEFTAAPTTRGAVIFGGFTTSIKTFFLDENGPENPRAILDCAYLADTFEFLSSADSFCMIQTKGDSPCKRAKCVLVSDGEDCIYAVHGYHGGCGSLIQGYLDIHALDLKRTYSTTPQPTVNSCACCSKSTNQEKLKKCNGVCGRKAWYCSSVCQKQHWPEHKAICGRKT